MSENRADLVAVFRTTSARALRRATWRLESHGIASIAQREDSERPADPGPIDPEADVLESPVLICVSRQDAQTARQLLLPSADLPLDEVPAEPIILPELNQPTGARRPFPGVGGAILLSLLLLAMQVAGGTTYGIVLAAAGGPDSAASHPYAAALATAVINIASFVVVMLVGLAMAKCPLQEVLPLSAFRWTVLLAIVFAVEGIGILASESDNLLRSVFPMPDFLAQVVSDLGRGGIATFFALVIVAPFTEELLFRGLILRGLLARYRTHTAILVSAVLFALVHVNPYQFCSAFLAGVFLAWLFVRTRSLWPCIIAHAFFNLHPIVLPIAQETFGFEIPGYTGPPDAGIVQFQPLWFDILGLMLLGIGIWATCAVTRRAAPLEGEGDADRR